MIQKSRTDLIVLGTSIASGGNSTSSSLDCSLLEELLVGMQVTFGGTPDDNPLLEVLTSPDDTNWDTVAYAQFEIDYSASQTLMKSIPVNVDSVKYVKIKITNQDSADAITVWGFVVGTKR